MARVTKAQLDAALEGYVSALKASGLEAFTDVELQHGSKVNGNSYKLYRTGSSQRAIGVQSFGFIGWTASEAYETLRLIARTILDVRDAR